jgi:hypothetical protein
MTIGKLACICKKIFMNNIDYNVYIWKSLEICTQLKHQLYNLAEPRTMTVFNFNILSVFVSFSATSLTRAMNGIKRHKTEFLYLMLHITQHNDSSRLINPLTLANDHFFLRF